MEGLQVTLKNGVKIIKFNKPQRKNAINRQIYIKLTETLNQDSLDESVIVTIITGEGEYFTSGNDIKDAMQLSTGADPEAARVEANQVFKNLIQAFINYPKLLIAVVNGPAIGIGATMVGLCDVVYASDRATFHTPFVSLGLCCEGCSSYVFPMNMGRSKASEMLLLGRKITSQEAYASNLIARVIPHEKLEQLFDDLQLYGTLPLQTLAVNKKLIVDGFKKTLHNCNDQECIALLERTDSEDFYNAMAAFMSRKSKL